MELVEAFSSFRSYGTLLSTLQRSRDIPRIYNRDHRLSTGSGCFRLAGLTDGTPGERTRKGLPSSNTSCPHALRHRDVLHESTNRSARLMIIPRIALMVRAIRKAARMPCPHSSGLYTLSDGVLSDGLMASSSLPVMFNSLGACVPCLSVLVATLLLNRLNSGR